MSLADAPHAAASTYVRVAGIHCLGQPPSPRVQRYGHIPLTIPCNVLSHNEVRADVPVRPRAMPDTLPDPNADRRGATLTMNELPGQAALWPGDPILSMTIIAPRGELTG